MVFCFFYFIVVELFMCLESMLFFEMELIEGVINVICVGSEWVEWIS